jgi:hypothetical protein
MATYVANDNVYPTVGEIVTFLAVRSGLVSTDASDPVYDHLKLFVREQKGKDFAQLEKILDELQRRLEECLAPPGLGDITFDVFRRFLDRYKSLILRGRANGWGREQFIEEKLVPEFIVPYAAWLLRQLNKNPYDFLSIDELLRSDAPLKVALNHSLSLAGKSWLDLAEIYRGKTQTYGGKRAVHDIADNKKLMRKWGTGKATPSIETCLKLLEELELIQYSGIVFWVWIARFLQKIDGRYRILIADAIHRKTEMQRPADFGKALSEESDALARATLSKDALYCLRQLTNLLFDSKHRRRGDKARAEQLLAAARELVSDASPTKYYITWLEARYHLYCRDMPKALAGYEQAFYEGMYGDFQAETMVLPEWAAIAQKAGDGAALKRIDSRMKLLRMYPTEMNTEEVAALRMKAFHNNFGAGMCFIEAFAIATANSEPHRRSSTKT